MSTIDDALEGLPDGDKKLDTKNKWNYPEFLNQIDTVIMGKIRKKFAKHIEKIFNLQFTIFNK